MDNDIKVLAEKLEEYVKIIKKEYKKYIPIETLVYLNEIDDFKKIIKIKGTGTISMFVEDGIIFFPKDAYKVIGFMSKIPGFGKNKEHKSYTKETIIDNDNNFQDYIKHVFISGLTPLEYFQETLLHETMHLCGVGGSDPLKEGFAELKTRELALKYNLLTTACGYPKEIKIALKLQGILGDVISNKIAFASNDYEIYRLLEKELGKKELELYKNIIFEMERVFRPYYEKKYPGLTGPFKKTKEYSKIDYSRVYEIIDDYINDKTKESRL